MEQDTKSRERGPRTVEEIGRFEERRTLNSANSLLVLVHGLRGHYKKTWGCLPDLMEEDSRFDSTDLHLFGYT